MNQPCSTGLTVKLGATASVGHQSLEIEVRHCLPGRSSAGEDCDRPPRQVKQWHDPQQRRLGIDETPTKQASQKAWLGTFVADSFTVFAVRLSRAGTVLSELLTESFEGIIPCDRAKMYWNLGLDPPPDPLRHRLQWCGAHWSRDFQTLIDHSDPQVKRLGDDLRRPTRELFDLWGRYREGTITRRGFQRLMNPIRCRIDRLLLRGVFSGNPHRLLPRTPHPFTAPRDVNSYPNRPRGGQD